MSKIICDICGTSYPDTEEACPICGYSQDQAAELLGLDAEEEAPKKAAKPEGRVAAASKPKAAKKQEEIFEDEDDEDDDFEDEDEDFDDESDEDEYDEDDEDDDDDDEDEDDDEEDGKSNAPLVILLVVVILALIAVSSFIFFRYFMPNFMAKETEPATTAAPVTDAPETTELRIACESLALTSGGEVVLGGEGANWLINVMALPENTTDQLMYASSDESVATVNEQGKVTAVGEGTAVITITCGDQKLTCNVTCSFVPETSVPETTVPETTAPDATEPETTVPETTVPEEPKEVTGIITASTLNIRSTPDTNGTPVGVYARGTKVTILEQKEVGGTTWGRTDRGWISMKHVDIVEDSN